MQKRCRGTIPSSTTENFFPNGLNKALLTTVFTANTGSNNLVLNYFAVLFLLFTAGSKQALTTIKWPKHEEYNAT